MSQRPSIGASLLALRMAALAAPPDTPTPTLAASARRASAARELGTADQPLPAYVTHALARWRLLHDVPFGYLVPDMRLLPLESVRFFSLDPDWLDALAEGALQSGAGSSREQRRAAAAAPAAMRAAQGVAAQVRQVGLGRLVVDGTLLGVDAPATVAADGSPVTGMLLHSALVSGWPGLKVCAWRSAAPADVPASVDAGELAAARPELVVPLLRVERLSPAILMVLFDGIPRLVWLEEPHHAVQFGIDDDSGGPHLALRDADGRDAGRSVPVPMRTGAVPGVVDVAALASRIDQALPLGTPRGSAALALQLLQAPSRQRFRN